MILSSAILVQEHLGRDNRLKKSLTISCSLNDKTHSGFFMFVAAWLMLRYDWSGLRRHVFYCKSEFSDTQSAINNSGAGWMDSVLEVGKVACGT